MFLLAQRGSGAHKVQQSSQSRDSLTPLFWRASMMFTIVKRTKKEISQTRSSIPSTGMLGRLSKPRVLGILPVCAFITTTLLLPIARPITTHAVGAMTGSDAPRAAGSNHIKEVIPERFQKKYQKWKDEYLSTKVGQEQWERYAHSSN